MRAHILQTYSKASFTLSRTTNRRVLLDLAVVMDLYSRAVIGWSMSERLTAELAIQALTMALWRRKPAGGLLHHSDRGIQLGFNSSSQHWLCRLRIAAHRELQQVSSIRESCEACC